MMSRKARHCLQHFLHVNDSLESGQQINAGNSGSDMNATGSTNSMPFLFDPGASFSGALPGNYLLQSIEMSAQDFLAQYNQHEMLEVNYDLAAMYP